MKALTNILSHLLMLLMLFIVACTEETAEVDNLMRQEQYVTVRMNIPGMTATATRADDGVIESITALAFDDADKLLEIETITTVTNTNANDGFNGTFNLTVPNGTTTIHFLANLPDDYNLTNKYKLTDVKKESDLTKLSIGDWQTLRYWGMATYDGSNSTLSTTLYRNLAKISIKPSETDPEFNQFTQDQLKMTGFYMPNERGALIPNNNGAFDFDMNSNYCTIPQDVSSANYQLWDFTSMYAFEHENTDSNPTYIICKIGDYHYKVALADNEGNRYPIIRNHEYIIYVSDVDDYSHDDNYRADTYDKAFDKLPINLDVQQEVIETVELGISAATETLNYNDTSTEQVTVTVTNLEKVESLELTAPGFTIETDYATLQDGKYILDDGVTEIDFTLTLTDPAQAGTISVTGEGEFLNITNPNPITITPTLCEEVDGETVLWQGAVKMHIPDDGANHAGKVLIPYSFFFDENNDSKVPVGSIVRIESTGSNWLSADETNGDWSSIWSLNNNGQDLVLTQDMLITIRDNHNEVWGVDVAFVLQGGDGRVLNKVTLIPAKERIEAYITNGATLYYDGDDKTVTVRVTIPKGVSGLEINADDFTVKQGETSLTYDETNGVYTYSRGDATTQVDVDFVFTLKDGVTDDSSITFSDASNNSNVTGKTVVINVEKTLVQGAEQELWGSGEGEGSYTFSNNAFWSLLGVGGSGGTLASDKELFKAGATLKVAFTTTSDGYPLELFTNWDRDREFVEEYSYDEDSKYLIYKFVDDDFGGPGGTNDVTNAGLILAVIGNVTVTITKISIKPAPTTENTNDKQQTDAPWRVRENRNETNNGHGTPCPYKINE